MAKVKWTKEQEQAIYEKGSNILVAAAAREWKNSGFS
jgi:ATP-dependent exoDNAse (exonuclease V) beta subunit